MQPILSKENKFLSINALAEGFLLLSMKEIRIIHCRFFVGSILTNIRWLLMCLRQFPMR